MACGCRWLDFLIYRDSWIGCFFLFNFFRALKKKRLMVRFFPIFFSRVMFVCVEKQETKNPLTMRACFLHF